MMEREAGDDRVGALLASAESVLASYRLEVLGDAVEQELGVDLSGGELRLGWLPPRLRILDAEIELPAGGRVSFAVATIPWSPGSLVRGRANRRTSPRAAHDPPALMAH